jgi:hypothetical protein
MPSPRNPWERRRAQPSSLAPREFRRVLILCEDTKSAVDYFKQFPHDPDLVELQRVGTGMNTDSLMEEAIRRTMNATENGTPYSAVWVVFDKDDFPEHNYHRAFDLAGAHPTINACWSNECFELWYLLHFAYLDSGLPRKLIWEKLGDHLKGKYLKADDTVFQQIRPRLETALKNADHLYRQNSLNERRRANPSTRVHHLVRLLLSLAPPSPANDPA